MKKILYTMMCLVAVFCLAACNNNPENPNEGGNGNENGNGDTKTYAELIIGHWVLESAMQDNGGSEPVDMTPMYGGSAFQLTFQEGGILIAANGIEDAQMEYTIEGDKVYFIQAPGANPVEYLIEQCDETTLVIVNGAGTDYVTTMTLKRD